MENVLKNYTTAQIKKAKDVKAIIVDVDGVLTDGGIIYDNAGNELKKFNVKDGLIISHLRQAGIYVGVLTGRESQVVKLRCDELKFDFHYHGLKDKYEKYLEIKNEYQLKDFEIAYIGDDIIDLPLIKACGFGITPSDAKRYVSEYADLVTFSKGGNGVLREVADLVLAAKGLLKEILEHYLKIEN